MSASAAGRTTRPSSGLSQPLLDTGAYDVPRLARAGVPFEVGQTAIKLGRVRGGELQIAAVGRDTVPEVFGELNALGDGQLADVEVSDLHMFSLPSAVSMRNTGGVDNHGSRMCTADVGGITCSRAAAFWWMPLLRDSQGLDALDFRLDSLSRIPKVDGALRIEPELRRIGEQP